MQSGSYWFVCLDFFPACQWKCHPVPCQLLQLFPWYFLMLESNDKSVKISVWLHCTNSHCLRLETHQYGQTLLDTLSNKHMTLLAFRHSETVQTGSPSPKAVTHFSGTTFLKWCLEMSHQGAQQHFSNNQMCKAYLVDFCVIQWFI